MKKKQQTAITQVHLYIKEHFVKGEMFTSTLLHKKLKHLTPSSITAALWKLTEEGILYRDWSVIPYVHTVTNGTFCTRESESRGAPAEHHRHHKHQSPRQLKKKKGALSKREPEPAVVTEEYASKRIDEILDEINERRTTIDELKSEIEELKLEAEMLIDEL
jgi:hypothetical protein